MLEMTVTRQLGAFTLDVTVTGNGGVTALFGRSGSGKSSLVNMIAGLLRPDAGRIVVGGRVLFDSRAGIDLPPQQRRIGYVFQEARLFPHLSVRQNLLYGYRLTPRRARYVELAQVCELLGIGPLLQRRPGALSGGEKQRVAIGRALLASPQLLLMDEPLAALDNTRKSEILPYIERLHSDMHLPVVYVSHAVEEVMRLASTLVILDNGRVAAVGTVAELLGRLDLRPLTGRFDAGAVLAVQVAAHDEAYDLTCLEFAGGSLRVPRVDAPPGSRLQVRIRARDVALALQPLSGVSIRNQLPARIEEIVEEPGAYAEVRLSLGGMTLLARVTRLTVRELGLRAGMPVYALLKSVAIDRHSLGLAARTQSGVDTGAVGEAGRASSLSIAAIGASKT